MKTSADWIASAGGSVGGREQGGKERGRARVCIHYSQTGLNYENIKQVAKSLETKLCPCHTHTHVYQVCSSIIQVIMSLLSCIPC